MLYGERGGRGGVRVVARPCNAIRLMKEEERRQSTDSLPELWKRKRDRAADGREGEGWRDEEDDRDPEESMVCAKSRKIHRSLEAKGQGGSRDRQIEEFRKEMEGFMKEAQKRKEEVRAEIGKVKEEVRERETKWTAEKSVLIERIIELENRVEEKKKRGERAGEKEMRE